jgi:hypothetical protein
VSLSSEFNGSIRCGGDSAGFGERLITGAVKAPDPLTVYLRNPITGSEVRGSATLSQRSPSSPPLVWLTVCELRSRHRCI